METDITTEKTEFDFNHVLAELQNGKEGSWAQVIKPLTEDALEAELDPNIAKEVTGNRKNGKSKKTIKPLNASFELKTQETGMPVFPTKMVRKHQTSIKDEPEQKIRLVWARYELQGHLFPHQ